MVLFNKVLGHDKQAYNLLEEFCILDCKKSRGIWTFAVGEIT